MSNITESKFFHICYNTIQTIKPDLEAIESEQNIEIGHEAVADYALPNIENYGNGSDEIMDEWRELNYARQLEIIEEVSRECF